MGSGDPKKSERIAATSVRIEQDKLIRFREVANANRRTVSQELRWLIDRAIEAHEEQAAA